MTSANFCTWCPKNQNRCDEKHAKKCDFASLEMKKELILLRAKKEYQEIEKLKEKIKKGIGTSEELGLAAIDAGDKAEGLRIMMEVLNEDFKMARIDVVEAIGIKVPNFIQQVKLMGKIKKLQMNRGR